MFSFDPNKVNLNKLVGNGGFGRVYAYEKNPGDEDWVVKIMGTKKFAEFLEHVQEIVLGFSLDHPNVIPIKGFHIDYDVQDERWNTYIKLPRMQISLKHKIEICQHEKKQFLENDIACYFYDLVCGLEYLHEKKIAHCDIKPANILIDKDNKLRIADFGIGKFVGDETSATLWEKGGTNGYIAPELIKSDFKLKKRDLFKADVWSLGLVMLEVSLLEIKFNQDINKFEEDLSKAKSKLKEKGYSNVLIDLISDLLEQSPQERMPLSRVKKILEENYSRFLKYSACYKKNIKEVRKNMKLKNGDLFKFQKETYEQLSGIRIAPKDQADYLKVDDEKIKTLFDDFAQRLDEHKLKRLEVLSINFQNCKNITDSAVIKLSTQIGENLKNLKYLTLEFQHCPNISEEGINSLSKQIGANFRKLEALFLYFRNSPSLTDKGAGKLVTQIASNCKQIQRLGLDFGNCNISEVTINKLAKCLSKSPMNLKKLYLYFFYCKNITEQSLLYLIDTVQRLKDIEALDLGLVGCNVSNVMIDEMTQCLKFSFKNLKSLTLYFDECDQITSEPVLKLAHQISLKKLQSLKVGLWKCNHINKETVISMCKIFGSGLKKLQTLKLWFDYVIDDKETQAFLTKSFNYIPELEIEC